MSRRSRRAAARATITAVLDHAPAILAAIRINRPIPTTAARDALVAFLQVAGQSRQRRQAAAERARQAKVAKRIQVSPADG